MSEVSRKYFDIITAGTRGGSVLTYHSNQKLKPGSIVKIPYGKRSVFGVIKQEITKPEFTTKPIEEVLELPTLPSYIIKLVEWISHYYGSDLGESLSLALPSRPDIKSKPAPKISYDSANKKSLTLTDSQKTIIDNILNKPDRSWLLHGVTGSGKTAVYIELASRIISQGKSVVVLVPEIALSKHIIDEFRSSHLDADLLTTHSQMSQSQRRGVWQKTLKSKKPFVVIGPRSSLFLPHNNLGLIIIDECHESSYKNESSPNYHAREVAAKIAELTDAKLLLGSATPSTQDILLHQKGRLSLVELPQAIHRNTRKIEIVDLRQSKSILSPTLQSGLKENFKNKQQSLLFINRRGSASSVVCSDCGLVETCSECQIPQTWHGDEGRLRCHWCGKSTKLSPSCTDCGSTNRRFIGVGTKRVESEVKQLLPKARVHRLDRDSFSAKTIEDTLKMLNNGEIDILIGTQMIAKGLDLPKITLVGVVLADTSLHIPDLYSNEKTYQLLHQVIGRSSRRADQPSRVILQTYSPDHRAIKLAAEHNFDQFIKEELSERKALGYPPYKYLLKLTCKRKTQAGAKKAADKLAQQIAGDNTDLVVRGPAPSWQETKGGYWYWHIIITSSKRGRLLELVSNLPANWRADIDPIDLL